MMNKVLLILFLAKKRVERGVVCGDELHI